ncbi:hypothetical protein FOXYS1_6851 [Fusarium oxysporum]|uniref:Uncharacterized protein n=1 Tax=Fusarium oxysporum TaxID=5507 RepID=A0A8H5EJ06_FUSOX|nr:hypothetical protein FOXYS1_6851 [Fusarium oxysporum]
MTRRLTKVLIINQTLEHVRQHRHLCIAASRDMHELLVENYNLALEVNVLRAQLEGPALPPVQARPMTEAMTELARVEHQLLGTFPTGFGDNGVETSSQPQSETRDGPYGVVSSTDTLLLATTLPPTADITADAGPIGIDLSLPGSIPNIGSEALCFLDMLASVDLSMSDRTAMAATEPVDTTESLIRSGGNVYRSDRKTK